MGASDTIEIGEARVVVERRRGFLYMRELGTLSSLHEVRAYFDAMDMVISTSGIKRALVDARDEAPLQHAPAAATEAMWDWLAGPRGFDVVAYVLGDAMVVTRVNMKALSRAARVKAFTDIRAAQQWLMRTRHSSSFPKPTLEPKPELGDETG